ncbi:MAG TPA: hypothetical protein VGH82_12700 [Gaiellaceae bacterium]
MRYALSAVTANARGVLPPDLACVCNGYDVVAGARLLRTRLERRLAVA